MAARASGSRCDQNWWVTAKRFRHGTRILRWRSDKDPWQCTLDQLAHELRPAELGRLIKR